MKVADFDFHLPDELIAQTAAPRGESRLLVLDRVSGAVTHARIRDLPRFLRRGDLLVVNDTRVFPARLLGRRVPSGGAVECLLLTRDEPDGASSGTDDQVWSALVHPGQKLRVGACLRFEGSDPDAPVIHGAILERQFFGKRRIRLWTDADIGVDAAVDAIGHVPLPPYIHHPDSPEDRERYQTIFASARGSVAAPTAGLHFDRSLFEALDAAGVSRASVTLHVGYGTFQPVRVDDVEQHTVDPEPYSIAPAAADAINTARAHGRRVIAVGTTTTRALEDAAVRGSGSVVPGAARATVFIHPGVGVHVIDGLLTNFHLPRSSLLMLVSAFAGRENVLAAYHQAVAERYRFYSYGDAMLIV